MKSDNFNLDSMLPLDELDRKVAFLSLIPRNGGTWQPVHRVCSNDFMCVCVAGFSGKFCEQNVTLSLNGFWPVVVAFKGYNGKYLSRKHRSGID
ncbi:hypothetical protein pdam_00020951 [Pocillopora damicornis]|uniref:EGF-like domain-containing protein n=1 Tax=Pocillopora damicornis TaxID=46731 RepID=A0A3M6TUZ6_POCDA|nr:hypothetical protein pdam_00020951 [Pocillopora damicornis]